MSLLEGLPSIDDIHKEWETEMKNTCKNMGRTCDNCQHVLCVYHPKREIYDDPKPN